MAAGAGASDDTNGQRKRWKRLSDDEKRFM